MPPWTLTVKNALLMKAHFGVPFFSGAMGLCSVEAGHEKRTEELVCGRGAGQKGIEKERDIGRSTKEREQQGKQSRQTGRQTDRQTDRQTASEKERNKYIVHTHSNHMKHNKERQESRNE